MSRRALLRAWPALLLIAAVAVAGAAYLFSTPQSKRAAPAQASLPAPRQELPASHPPVPAAPPGAGAREGTVTVDPAQSFTHYRVGNNSVTAIHADGSLMWLGTSGGMVRYDTSTGEFRTYDTRNGPRSNGILSLGKVQGKIAVGTYGGGLSLLDRDGKGWEHYGVAEGLADAFVYDVLEAANADVWIATGAGVNRVRGGALRDRAKWELHTAASTAGGLPHDRIQGIVEGRDGVIWFATRGGVARFRAGKWDNWTHATGLGAAREGARAETAPGGGAPAGRAKDAHGEGAKAAVNPSHVAALAVGRDGIVWAGTWGSGLARYDGKGWRIYGVAEGLPDDQISTLNFDRAGQLWIGTREGLAVLGNGKFRVLGTEQGLITKKVYAVTIASDGGVWVGGFGGVAHIRQPDSSTSVFLSPAPLEAPPAAARSS